jgi:hypothetical protein
MKVLLSICMILATTIVWASETNAPVSPAAATSSAADVPAAPSVTVQGKVLEVKNVDSYTYLRLNTNNGELWVAVMKAQVMKGTTVTIDNGVFMNNFESKSLKRTFPTILFGTLGGATEVAPGSHNLGASFSAIPKKKLDSIVADVHVDKASGADARTVGEITAKRAELKDKPVSVRGKVVKFNPGIMGRNWVHIRDGSGSAADESNDLLVTTQSETKVGAIVTAKGTVRTDKDFGSGYAYKVLVEEATLQ